MLPLYEFQVWREPLSLLVLYQQNDIVFQIITIYELNGIKKKNEVTDGALNDNRMFYISC